MRELDHRALLEAVRAGALSVDDGLARLRQLDADDLGFAQIDHHRSLRKGFPEVVYCEGKTAEQSAAILLRLCEVGTGPVLGTRVQPEVYQLVRQQVSDFTYYPLSRVLLLRRKVPVGKGEVLMVCAGTSDLPVLEEAQLTAELMGARVKTLTDVGVAGLHRLLVHLQDLYAARVLVVIAGMEGALPSVIAGLVDAPVIAVPTSVGYGTNFQGLTPLLSMLNSCASGVGVVNIDNGFGAGYLAALINRQGEML
ncbi:nickel pincer cofactor biosynthesis protein LarB [Alicyclobacillaceae bacterium I2511]|nr:nickel pincer cofactor biosynthesis protein LarB [Alicyclobacillaceae bacterium I2511]